MAYAHDFYVVVEGGLARVIDVNGPREIGDVLILDWDLIDQEGPEYVRALMREVRDSLPDSNPEKVAILRSLEGQAIAD